MGWRRRVFIWGTAIQLLLWGTSRHLTICWNLSDRAQLAIGAGAARFMLINGDLTFAQGVYGGRTKEPWSWWFHAMVELEDGYASIVVPLWSFAAGLGGIGLALEVRSRRSKHGLCASCGYDRSGIGVASLCPECGAGA
jgi:hypothetical protein